MKRPTTQGSSVNFGNVENSDSINLNINGNNKTAKKRKVFEDAGPPKKDEEDQLYNIAQNDTDVFASVFLKLQKNERMIQPVFHWVINSVDMAEKTLAYQKAYLALTSDSGFVLKTHAHKGLMLSSILLIKLHQHSSRMPERISTKELDTIRKYVLEDICNEPEFNDGVAIRLTKIITQHHSKNHAKNKITREDSLKEFSSLCNEIAT
ncbi:uncharacterized protein ATC70_007485 [Mucor velutinosus]|uniref:Uncharacterized protein n=1 Tax=Mucor velutinosus TaxID=708070 RepID=A0AAN7HPW1_9FUNG|nr:hypothetical protein ATC70_007485 [Mucor velutinosus]